VEIVMPALITGGFSLIGIIITNLVTISSNNKKLTNKIKEENTKMVNDLKLEVTKNQAITDTKIEELTREVREHNNFAKRMPVVENEIKHIEETIDKYHK
jgi:hypothetical protein